MNNRAFLDIITAAICYFLYNWLMFNYISMLLGESKPSPGRQFVTFAINYIAFVFITYAGFLLTVNWIIFAVFLIVEVAVLYKQPFLVSVFCGLQGAMVGLAVNLFTRASASIIMGLPLISFDSRINLPEDVINFKLYPVNAGFLLSALLFWVFTKTFRDLRDGFGKRNSGSLKFAVLLIAAIYCYLILNLLIYSLPANELPIKIWQLKSSVCALAVFYIGMRYVRELDRLKRFELQGHEVRTELSAHEETEKQLSQLAFTDCLTGCFSRNYGERVLDAYFAERKRFRVCFVDLNRLKPVNDNLGHGAGDKYLAAAAYALTSSLPGRDYILCRYGGDEFLLICPGGDEQAVLAVMENAQLTLSEMSNTSEYPFSMSISYGIRSSDGYISADALIKDADADMYEHKKTFKVIA